MTFEIKGNERLYNLFLTVEMPIVEVAAEMELEGICIDTEFAERLSKKYHTRLEKIDKEVEQELKPINNLFTPLEEASKVSSDVVEVQDVQASAQPSFEIVDDTYLMTSTRVYGDEIDLEGIHEDAARAGKRKV